MTGNVIHDGMDCLIVCAASHKGGVRRMAWLWFHERACWLRDIGAPDWWVIDCILERRTWRRKR